MNKHTQRFPWVAFSTATLFVGVALAIPPGKHVVSNATIEINSMVFWIIAAVFISLSILSRASTNQYWSRLASKAAICMLLISGLHLAVLGVVLRVMTQ
jgi:hypothetical protein